MGPILGGIAGIGAGAAADAISFGVDPMGFIYVKVQEAASGLALTVLPALFDATKPDLSAEWFLQAYAISGALAIFMWVGVLLWSLTMSARGQFDSSDVAELLTTRAAFFFLVLIFGPAAGWVVLQTVGALSDSLAQWAIGGSSQDAIAAMGELVAEFDGPAVAGGVLVGIVLMLFMLVGLVLVIISLFVMMVAIYLGAAVVPLAAAWQASPRYQQITSKLLFTLAGVVLAKPLLFLMLGVAYKMTAGSIQWMAEPSLASMANLVAAAIAIAIAGLAPFLLFKFAPVMPMGAGQAGPSLAGGGGNDGPSQPSKGSPAQQEAQRNGEESAARESSASTDGPGQNGPGATSPDGESQQPGPIESALRDQQRVNAVAGDDGAASGGEQAAASVPAGVGGEAVDGAAGVGTPGAGGAPGAAGQSAGAVGEGGTAAAAGEGAAGAGAAAGGGAAAGSGAAAAGTAAAGVATGGLALVGAAALSAAEKAKDVAMDAGQQAASDMDGGQQ